MVESGSVFVVSLTPFTSDGSFDEQAMRLHLRRMARSGIGVYVAGSGSGEGYTLTRRERLHVMELAVEELGGRVPVRVMGVEPRSAAEAKELGVDAASVGVDAMQLYSLDLGHGYRPRTEELSRYLHEVLEAVQCQVVLSTHQSVGYHYPVDLLDEVIATFDHVIGINVTTPDIGYLSELIEAVDGRVEVHVGGPMHAVTAMTLGAQGYLCSEGNLVPGLAVSVVDAFMARDRLALTDAYSMLLRVFRRTQDAGGIVGAKAALRRLGAPGGWPRPPRLDPEAASVDVLVDLLRSTGLAVSEGLEP